MRDHPDHPGSIALLVTSDEFGPVNRSIHKVNEAVALAEIEPLAEIYRLALVELTGAK